MYSAFFLIATLAAAATAATVTDLDGNVYKIVTIGTQTWFASNLNVTQFSDGTTIPHVVTSDAWGVLTTPAYSHYNHDSATYAPIYGALYNWFAVNSSVSICPTGYKVPTSTDWRTLFKTVGGTNSASGVLKSADLSLWAANAKSSTDAYNFTVLPGGGIDGTGRSGHFSEMGKMWSNTQGSTSIKAIPYYFQYSNNGVGSDDYAVQGGLSVRCLKSDTTTETTSSATSAATSAVSTSTTTMDSSTTYSDSSSTDTDSSTTTMDSSTTAASSSTTAAASSTTAAATSTTAAATSTTSKVSSSGPSAPVSYAVKYMPAAALLALAFVVV